MVRGLKIFNVENFLTSHANGLDFADAGDWSRFFLAEHPRTAISSQSKQDINPNFFCRGRLGLVHRGYENFHRRPEVPEMSLKWLF